VNQIRSVSLSLAQFRMLGRAIRGQRLHVSRFRPEHATVAALAVKRCWHLRDGRWVPTELGLNVHRCRGFYQPDRLVWNSASRAEREAFRRVAVFHSTDKEDVALADQLQRRLEARGEVVTL